MACVTHGCDRSSTESNSTGTTGTESVTLTTRCQENDENLVLPGEFCARIIADLLGPVRNLVINDNGDIYVGLINRRLKYGGLLGLRDQDGDGKIDLVKRLNDIPAFGMSIHNGYLFFSSDTTLYKYKLDGKNLVPESEYEVVIDNFPNQELHAGKAFTISTDNWIYVNVGATSNNCSDKDEITGLQPCPDLEQHAGIWRFSSETVDQDFLNDGIKYTGGIRNAYAIDWESTTNKIYVIQHGRDRLRELWSDLYTQEKDSILPAEEFLILEENINYSWPYCYFDQTLNRLVLSPEYGGNGEISGICAEYPSPVMAFPGHLGPNALKFYKASQFPEKYHHGAIIAFHGSNRIEENKLMGNQVAFVPFKNGLPQNEWEVFISGFTGIDNKNKAIYEYRPTGLAIGPEGSLYVADSTQGRIWKINYIGVK